MLLKKRRLGAFLLTLLAMGACDRGAGSVGPVPGASFGGVEVRLGDLRQGHDLPEYSTCDGSNIPPSEISWKGPPDTKEWVITMTDPDAPGGQFVHWTVYGLGSGTTSLSSGTLPLQQGGGEGKNDFGDAGYGGPCPPEGDEPHHYVFTVYALDSRVTSRLPGAAEFDELLDAMECCVIGQGAFIASYER